jgi:hypothetical protein
VAPFAIGRRVEIRADADSVTVTCAGEVVARHARSLLRHRVVTDPVHVTSRVHLREERRDLERPRTEADVEVRDLAVYDALFEVAS